MRGGPESPAVPSHSDASEPAAAAAAAAPSPKGSSFELSNEEHAAATPSASANDTVVEPNTRHLAIGAMLTASSVRMTLARDDLAEHAARAPRVFGPGDVGETDDADGTP